MAYETYEQINGVIREIQRGDSCCSQILRLDTENGEVRFTVMADTMVIENVRLRRGMRVAAFYDTSLPVPAIYPPQYRAEIVTVLRGEQNVMLNFFGRAPSRKKHAPERTRPAGGAAPRSWRG